MVKDITNSLIVFRETFTHNIFFPSLHSNTILNRRNHIIRGGIIRINESINFILILIRLSMYQLILFININHLQIWKMNKEIHSIIILILLLLPQQHPFIQTMTKMSIKQILTKILKTIINHRRRPVEITTHILIQEKRELTQKPS